MNNKPIALSDNEWREIFSLESIQTSWGLDSESEPETDYEQRLEWFKEMVYATKFKFNSGSPGYCGDLFILQGDTLTGDSPIVLIRNGKGSRIDYAYNPETL